MTDSTIRFGERADDYARYRPGYPAGVRDWLHARGLEPSHVIADVGAGTGLLTELFIAGGHRVHAVEPNADMRAKADAALGANPLYASCAGTAEATTLADESIDLVTAGQAFHWFDPTAAKAEWRRILRPPGRVALVWNDRLADASPFMAAYEQLLCDWGIDYAATTYKHRPIEHTLAAFFDGPFETHGVPNAQRLGEAGLLGRFFSSSYTPSPDHPDYSDAVAAARRVFRDHAHDGAVELLYSTLVYAGQLEL